MKKLSILSLLLAIMTFAAPSGYSDDNRIHSGATVTEVAVDPDRHYLDSLWHALYPDITIQSIDTTLSARPGSPDKAPALSVSSHIPVSVEIDRTKAVGEIPISSKVSDTGAKCYEIPISVYPGMNGHQPELTIVYNSQSGNGIMGYGWSLTGVSAITVTPKNHYFDGEPAGIKVCSDDAFLLDGVRLIKKESQETYNLYQSEYGNIKAKGYIKDAKIQYFDVFYPDGRKGTYGSSSLPSRINYPITSLKDIHGNSISYTYSYSFNTYRLENISYNGCSVVFSYISREDSYNNYRGGLGQTQAYLLSAVTCKIGSEILGTYRMSYNTGKRVALLESVGYESQGKSFNPIKMYYGTGVSSFKDENSSTLLTKFHSSEKANALRTVKGRFDNTPGADGLVICENKIPYYRFYQNFTKKNYVRSQYGENDIIFAYTRLSSDFYPIVSEIKTGLGFMSLLCADLKGTGKESLIKVNNLVATNPSSAQWEDQVVFAVYDTDGYNELQQSYTRSFFFTTLFTDPSGHRSVNPKYYFAGDFTGNGKMEILAVSGHRVFGDSSCPSTCYLFDLENNKLLYKGEVFQFVVELLGQNQTDAKAAANKTDKLFALDFDGDGKTDICHIGDNGVSVYTFTSNGQTLTCGRMVNWSGLTRKGLENREVLCGDFNGDGQGDFLVSPDHEKSTDKSWTTYLANGLNTFVPYTATGSQKEDRDFCGYIVQDIDNDGKSDLVVHDSVGMDIRIAQRGDLFVGATYKYLTAQKQTLLPLNCGNGDKRTVVIGLKGATLTRYGFSGLSARERLLTGVVNSLGMIEKNEYHCIDDDNVSGGFYTYALNAAFPWVNLREAVNVVTSYSVFLNGEERGKYRATYHNAVCHRQGRGFCGFERVSQYDSRYRLTEKTMDPFNYGVVTKLKTPEAEISSEYDVVGSDDRIVLVTQKKKTEMDLLRGTTATTTYTYDQYGMPLRESTVTTGNFLTEVNCIYNTQATPQDGYHIGFLTSKETKTYRDGKLYTEKEDIPAHSNMLPTLRRLLKNGNSVEERIYRYDSHGNPLTETVKEYTSTPPGSTAYEYDSYGRVTKTTDPMGLSKSLRYDSRGRLQQQTDCRGGVTSYEYDEFGREKSVSYPDGTKRETSFSWNVTAGNACYSSKKTLTGSPDATVEFDACNREVRRRKKLIQGKEAWTDRDYDSFGNISKVSLPYFQGGSPSWTLYSYDSHDRLVSIEDASGRNTTHSYSGLKVTTEENGISMTRTFDPFGNLTAVSDPGGETVYTLAADGQPLKVEIGGVVTFSFTYDSYRRISVTDEPGFGKTTYAYDTYGNVTKETHADGKSVSRTFDSHHRLTREEADGLITMRTYNDKGDLSKVSSANGWSKTFTYDDRGRVATLRENGLSGMWLQKDYTYSAGNVSSLTYTTNSGINVKETYTYANGYLSEVRFNGSTIYKLTAQTALGADEKVTSGDLSVEKSYDSYGYPSAEKVSDPVKGTVYQNFGYQFKPSNSTLLMRKDEIRKNMDVFSYDKLNRLTGTASVRASYDNVGNMLTKSDVGSFSYDLEDRPYSMSGAELSQSGVMSATQTVAYTSFRRPSSVSVGSVKAGFTYSGDYDRILMSVTDNGSTKLTRHYLGGCYEADKTPTGLREKIYLTGGYYGAPAVYLKEGGTGKLYFILRDYLGSITHVVDEEGNVVQELGYDAWGRLRTTMNGSSYAPGTEPELFLGRGYTGHEHLPMLGLVNMNSRLYDPFTARFLSPDPVLEMAEGTQGFNRYAYAMNNPLCYVDEDGEMPVILAAALIGGVINLTSKLLSGQVHNFQDGLAAFGIGAVAGMGGAVGGALGYCLTGAGGLVGGAAAGLLGNAMSMPLQSWGNSLYFHDPFMTTQEYVTGMAFGALSGGLTNGLTSGLQGRNVWTGNAVRAGESVFSFAPSPAELEVSVMYSKGKHTSTGSTKVKPYQKHHFATNKNKKYTPQFKKILADLGLKLNSDWNIKSLPHQGRHPDAYHEWVLKEMFEIKDMVISSQMGNLSKTARQALFKEQFNNRVINEVIHNPDMLYKQYWIK